MTAGAFDKDRPETWPVLMDADEVARIFRLSVPYVHRLVTMGRFRPAPMSKDHPRRWRRDAVEREVFGSRRAS
jgi:hypothetical protein